MIFNGDDEGMHHMMDLVPYMWFYMIVGMIAFNLWTVSFEGETVLKLTADRLMEKGERIVFSPSIESMNNGSPKSSVQGTLTEKKHPTPKASSRSLIFST